MNKEERDKIEASLDPNRRFIMPSHMTDKMRSAAYIEYCKLHKDKGYIAWDDVCKIFVAAFNAS